MRPPILRKFPEETVLKIACGGVAMGDSVYMPWNIVINRLFSLRSEGDGFFVPIQAYACLSFPFCLVFLLLKLEQRF